MKFYSFSTQRNKNSGSALMRKYSVTALKLAAACFMFICSVFFLKNPQQPTDEIVEPKPNSIPLLGKNRTIKYDLNLEGTGCLNVNAELSSFHVAEHFGR